MEATLLTRRQFLAASGIAALLPSRRAVVLQTEAVRLQLDISGGVVTARSFENRLAGQAIPLPPELFRLEFDDGSSLSSVDFAVRIDKSEPRAVELLCTQSGEIEVRVP